MNTIIKAIPATKANPNENAPTVQEPHQSGNDRLEDP